MNAENNDDTANSPAPSPTIEEAGIRSGMYKVGQDIAAGEYKLYSTADLSYFEIAKDSSNTLESIIANDNFYSSLMLPLQMGNILSLPMHAPFL